MGLELHLAHEVVGTAVLQILMLQRSTSGTTRRSTAARLQNAATLEPGRPRRHRATEMLDHVRRIDDIDRAGAVGNVPGGIGIADLECVRQKAANAKLPRSIKPAPRNSRASNGDFASQTAGELS